MEIASKFAIFVALSLLGKSVFAQVPFNYNVRTRPYSGWDSTLRGDIDTIGMAGATTAVPYNVSSATANPAGFAMVQGGLLLQINKNTIHDDTIQRTGDSYDSSQFGLAINPPGWGFAISWTVPKSETGTYISPNTGHPLNTDVSVKRLQLSIARNFWEDAFSLGVGVGLDFGVRDLGDFSYGGSTPMIQVGGLWKLRHHWILGFDASPQTTIGAAHAADQNELPGFNQPILTPAEFAVGTGWVTNRFFKVGLDFHYIAGTANTALLADQNVPIGQTATLEPRLGASYVFVDYPDLQAIYSMGSYYEQARVQDAANRVHGTAGLQINPWFINTGFGIDFGANYRNIMITIGIDIVRTARILEIIPPDPIPHQDGFFPAPGVVSAIGLPHAMTSADPNKGIEAASSEDIKKILSELPERIRKRWARLLREEPPKRKPAAEEKNPPLVPLK